MEQPDNKPKASDDLDLAQFFRWIGRGFRSTGVSILSGLATLRNLFFTNRLFFGGIILIGLILGTLYSELLKKKFYRSSMVFSCDYLNTQILENTIEKLNLLCDEPEREGLAQTLAIDPAIAKNVQRFDFEPFVSEDDVVEMEVLREQLNNVTAEKKELVDKVIDKLAIVNKNAYEISVEVYDPDIVKQLEKAIINYFKTNEYIKRRIEINQTNRKKRRAKVIRELGKLDSLKSILYQNYEMIGKTSRGSNNVILGDEKLANPLEVYTQDLELHTELLEIDRAIYIQPDFEVVDGFTTFKEPDSASLPKILIISFLISWVMGYLIIGAWRLDNLLANYNTKA